MQGSLPATTTSSDELSHTPTSQFDPVLAPRHTIAEYSSNIFIPEDKAGWLDLSSGCSSIGSIGATTCITLLLFCPTLGRFGAAHINSPNACYLELLHNIATPPHDSSTHIDQLSCSSSGAANEPCKHKVLAYAYGAVQGYSHSKESTDIFRELMDTCRSFVDVQYTYFDKPRESMVTACSINRRGEILFWHDTVPWGKLLPHARYISSMVHIDHAKQAARQSAKGRLMKKGGKKATPRDHTSDGKCTALLFTGRPAFAIVHPEILMIRGLTPDTDMLQYSTSPDIEPEWFSDHMRQSYGPPSASDYALVGKCTIFVLDPVDNDASSGQTQVDSNSSGTTIHWKWSCQTQQQPP